LRRVQHGFDVINQRLSARRDPIDDRVIENLLAGYAYVDTLVADDVDVLAMGNLRHLLELNTLVLCGTSPVRRRAYRRHIETTTERFYGEPDGGIGDLVEWGARLARRSVWERAAGIYVRVLSKPQLFSEGNHRTGTLIMSYLLLREGQPPFVLTVANAAAYFAPSPLIRATHKHGVGMSIRMPFVRRRLAALVRASADRRYLLT
jgi:hypothetical protein